MNLALCLLHSLSCDGYTFEFLYYRQNNAPYIQFSGQRPSRQSTQSGPSLLSYFLFFLFSVFFVSNMSFLPLSSQKGRRNRGKEGTLGLFYFFPWLSFRFTISKAFPHFFLLLSFPSPEIYLRIACACMYAGAHMCVL